MGERANDAGNIRGEPYLHKVTIPVGRKTRFVRVMAMAFGAFFLHERLTAREGIGGFFIAAGALILAWK